MYPHIKRTQAIFSNFRVTLIPRGSLTDDTARIVNLYRLHVRVMKMNTILTVMTVMMPRASLHQLLVIRYP